MLYRSDTVEPRGFVRSHDFYAMFGPSVMSFSRISNIEEAIGYEAIAEGGQNNGVRILPKNNSQVCTATFEKVVHTKDAIEFDAFVHVGSQYGIVNVFVTSGSKPLKLYVLSDCLIVKRTLSELDAATSAFLTMKLELVYSYMNTVPLAV